MATGEEFINTLAGELEAIDGVHAQDLETGGKNIRSVLANYTNKLFGAPYQLLDSVDRRFETVNPNVGSEYLRNFLLHSPILHIRPGMPKYTGGDDPTTTFRQMQRTYRDVESETMSISEGLIEALAEKTVFSAGSKLQRRMFGLRPTYLEYMMYVNYMCRSVAILLGLTADQSSFPNGTFLNDMKFTKFESVRWENYRMVGNTYVDSALEVSKKLADAAGVTAVVNTGTAVGSFFIPWGDDFIDGNSVSDKVSKAWNKAMNTSLSDVVTDRVQSVMFMVEPAQFGESISNEVSPSFIEGALDAISNPIGSEVAFITGSKADIGLIGGITEFLGSGMESASLNLGKMVEPVTGGFMNNLFSGAVKSLKGQKMIYPDIYRNSNSEMDYEFSVTLTTPYGDVYNYYMNIIVPLMHLIALAAPRMVTSNTVTSPFLVQAYVPGMCTCQMGIVRNMTITKNPNYKSVSVNGFPLTVRVTFHIKELYNALAISPAHDPASFLFNETLNDYMANLAGLIPSVDTFSKQRAAMFENLSEYFESGDFASGLGDYLSENVSDALFQRTM